MELIQVKGKDCGDVVVYALSTCGWCRKTKELLRELGVAYRYVDVDLQSVPDQKVIMEKISKMNPDGNFPTIIIDGDTCIIGFREAEIREALKQ